MMAVGVVAFHVQVAVLMIHRGFPRADSLMEKARALRLAIWEIGFPFTLAMTILHRSFHLQNAVLIVLHLLHTLSGTVINTHQGRVAVIIAVDYLLLKTITARRKNHHKKQNQ